MHICTYTTYICTEPCPPLKKVQEVGASGEKPWIMVWGAGWEQGFMALGTQKATSEPMDDPVSPVESTLFTCVWNQSWTWGPCSWSFSTRSQNSSPLLLAVSRDGQPCLPCGLPTLLQRVRAQLMTWGGEPWGRGTCHCPVPPFGAPTAYPFW